jgi:hypothetical protein
MTWTVELHIHNLTEYNIDVVNNDVGVVGVIPPQGNFNWSTQDPNNADALRFWITPNEFYMQGGVNFGPEAGVYIDRGWMEDQTIELTGDVNGHQFVQNGNGGAEVVPWNGFEGGGTINMVFTSV